MQENGKASQYFLSANTPQGFISRLEQLYNAREGWKAYILKGGPGTGKSYFIEKAGNAAAGLGMDVEYIHCTSDSKCLDGIAIPSLKICVVDGTPPHGIEPKYPGVVETIVNLGDCWSENRLAAEHDKIILFASRISAYYDRAYRFISAASSLLNDTYRLALEYTDVAKIEHYALRIAKREFPARRRQGRESIRFLSGITPEGVVCFKETATAMNKVFVIEDDFGVGRLLLNKLKNYSLSSGYDVISCYCPTAPGDKLDHLIIPSLSLAFVTSNHYHRIEGKGYRHIHIRRFMDNEAVKQRRARIVFNRKASRELIGESVKLLGEAKSNYDILKTIYASAMDFNEVEKKSDQFIKKVIKK